MQLIESIDSLSFLKPDHMKKLLALVVSIGMVVTGCYNNEELAPSTTKLDYYTDTYELDGMDFQAQGKTQYTYNNSGQLEKSTFYSYNPTSKALEEQRSFVFSYANGHVDKIDGFLVNTTTPYIKYEYQYLPDARLSKIKEINSGAGTSSEATFSYPASDSVKVAYTFSNGGSFEYYVGYKGKNILHDKTTRGSELCSNGTYTYDEKVNPFSTLGYIDYLLFNLSTNNKLTENVSYISCSFPSFIPESYTYEYNSEGYPTKATTNYKPGGSNLKSYRLFYYKKI